LSKILDLTLRLIHALEHEKFVALFLSLPHFADILKFSYGLASSQTCIEILISISKANREIRNFLFQGLEDKLRTFIEYSVAFTCHFNNFSNAELSYIDLITLPQEEFLSVVQYFEFIGADGVCLKIDLAQAFTFFYGDFNSAMEWGAKLLPVGVLEYEKESLVFRWKLYQLLKENFENIYRIIS
jgi:hypothetical protein